MGWLPKKSSLSRFTVGQFSRHPSLKRKTTQKSELVFAMDSLVARVSMGLETCDSQVARVPLGQPDVSVILPVYNEQSCIGSTFDAVLDYSRLHPTYQFIFVNDGSNDQTQRILEQRIAGAETEQIQLCAYPDRGGKGYAVRRGIENADGDYICFIDGDLAYSLDHLDLLVAKLQHYEMVIGCRGLVPGGDRGLNATRKVAGKIYNILSKRILNLRFIDMQAGLKGFQKQAARELFSRQALTGFSFDVELIYLAKKLGYAIGEIPAYVSVSHSRKISKVNLLMDSLKMLGDLFKIRLNDWLGRYE
jgi:glycosyltransferase involved in cell wall biosynthesis